MMNTVTVDEGGGGGWKESVKKIDMEFEGRSQRGWIEYSINFKNSTKTL